MKIQKKSLSKKSLIVAITVVILGCVIALYFFIAAAQNNSNNQTPTAPVTQEINDEQQNETDSPSGNLPDKTTTDSRTDEDFTGLTLDTSLEKPRIARFDASGSNVKIVANFDRESTNECIALFSQDASADIEYNSNITVGPTFYSCSFNIPVSTFQEGTLRLSLFQATTETKSENATESIEL